MRRVLYYKQYYNDFFDRQKPVVRKKLNWTLGLVSTLERIPVKFFKHIEGTDGLYEIRVEAESNIFRVFCFFDEGHLIILLNAFQKKLGKLQETRLN